MRDSDESDNQIILTTVASTVAGGIMLVMSTRSDGGTLWIIAGICFFGVVVVGVLQLNFRHR